jgi:hypothetical protein
VSRHFKCTFPVDGLLGNLRKTQVINARSLCEVELFDPDLPLAVHMAGMRTLGQLNTEDPQRILVAGDWHGNRLWMHQVLGCAARDGHEVIVHVGDLKVLWPHEHYPDFTEYTGFTSELVQDLEDLAWCSSSPTATMTCILRCGPCR